MNAQQIYDAVAERYSAVTSLANSGSQATYSKTVAQAFGYTEDELNGIPNESNLGLSCGNPLAIASLREGETIIDLGCGAGFDIFLASNQVGPSGIAIGVDMNKDMLSLAERNKIKSGIANVKFVESRITQIAIGDATADVIISNCVINLVPEEDKPRVFAEVFRLLKPGGRVAISDILAKQPLPERLKSSMAAYVGCIAGASLVGQYEAYFKQAGFGDFLIQDSNSDLNVYLEALPSASTTTAEDASDGTQRASGCCAALSTQPATVCCTTRDTTISSNDSQNTEFGDNGLAEDTTSTLDLRSLDAQLGGTNLNEWVGSYKIYAVKPLTINLGL